MGKGLSGFRGASGFRGEDLGFVGIRAFVGEVRASAGRVPTMLSWGGIRGEGFGLSRRGLRVLVGRLLGEGFGLWSGGFWAFVGGFGFLWGVSGFRTEGFGLSWGGFGLSREKIRAFVGRDSRLRAFVVGFRGDLGFRGSSSFRGEGFGLSNRFYESKASGSPLKTN